MRRLTLPQKQAKDGNSFIKGNIRLHTFSFLSAKELWLVSCVSSFWSKDSQAIINRTKGQIFFAVGADVYVGDHLHHPRGTAYPALRKSILPEEIKTSFTSQKTLKLFSTEKEALDYSRSQRTNISQVSDDRVYQPLVFAVQYLYQIPEVKKTLSIETKDYLERIMRTSDFSFFESDQENVIPLRAVIKIPVPVTDLLGPVAIETVVKEYPSFESPKRKCSIM